jgi:hypothetical protein
VRSSTYHFERLPEEVYPNHAYLINHNLRDFCVMKNFMISESLTQDMELDEVKHGGDIMPFPKEAVVMAVYGERPYKGGATHLT